MTQPRDDGGEPSGLDPIGGQPFVPAEEEARVWQWQCTDESGVAIHAPTPGFVSRQAAEDWLAEHFEDLAAFGVATVALFDGESVVYGPMPLTPEG